MRKILNILMCGLLIFSSQNSRTIGTNNLIYNSRKIFPFTSALFSSKLTKVLLVASCAVIIGLLIKKLNKKRPKNEPKLFKKIMEIKKSNSNIKECFSYNKLYKAVKESHTTFIENFFEKCGDVNAKSDQGYTFLHWATVSGHIEMVKLLLNKEGIDVNTKDDYNNTPLHMAARYGYKNIAESLLERDANITVINIFNDTPLDLAVINGNVETVELFLGKEKIEINAVKDNGKTIFHDAVMNGHKDVVKLLLKKGADITVDYYDNNSIDLAKINGYKDLAEFLEKFEKNKKINTNLT